MNVAYKHLDAKLRIAELTLGQWLGVIAGILLAIVWGMYVSPFGDYLTLISAVYVGALPIGAVVFAGLSEFDAWLMLRSALAWRRAESYFPAGAGIRARGYALLEPVDERRADAPLAGELDLSALWEEP